MRIGNRAEPEHAPLCLFHEWQRYRMSTKITVYLENCYRWCTLIMPAPRLQSRRLFSTMQWDFPIPSEDMESSPILLSPHSEAITRERSPGRSDRVISAVFMRQRILSLLQMARMKSILDCASDFPFSHLHCGASRIGIKWFAGHRWAYRLRRSSPETRSMFSLQTKEFHHWHLQRRRTHRYAGGEHAP